MLSNNQNPAQYEWGPFPFRDGEHIFDIRYDPVFKAVFTKDTSDSRGALSALISALIGRTVTVETIVANEPATDYMGQKKIRYDISCISKSGKRYNGDGRVDTGNGESIQDDGTQRDIERESAC